MSHDLEREAATIGPEVILPEEVSMVRHERWEEIRRLWFVNDEGLADVAAANPFRFPRLHPGNGRPPRRGRRGAAGGRGLRATATLGPGEAASGVGDRRRRAGSRLTSLTSSNRRPVSPRQGSGEHVFEIAELSRVIFLAPPNHVIRLFTAIDVSDLRPVFRGARRFLVGQEVVLQPFYQRLRALGDFSPTAENCVLLHDRDDLVVRRVVIDHAQSPDRDSLQQDVPMGDRLLSQDTHVEGVSISDNARAPGPLGTEPSYPISTERTG